MIGENQLLSISEQIKAIRKSKKMSLRQLAEGSSLSSAMLSKIENRRTIPSLSTLMAVATALKVDLYELLKNITLDKSNPYFLLKKNERKRISKEDAQNFNISFIHSLGIQSFNHLEINHIDMAPKSDRKMVETEGHQYIYGLKGNLTFILGEESLNLGPGDTLFFDGSVPHVPRNNSKSDVSFLVIYLLK
jgi:transcriptional regulator with XRE-family HTH domain